MTNRIIWVDYGKAIAIYLVVVAHTALYKPAEGFIYTFHMPFFFFMSGYLFNFGKYPSYACFAQRRFRQLIVPYMLLNVMTYLLWLFILRKVGSDAGENIGALSPLVAALTVNPKGMVHNVPLWFLAALFVVENLYYILYRNKKTRVAVTLLLFVLAYLNDRYNTCRIPFCIDISLVALLFYRFGNLMGEKGDKVFNPLLFVTSAIVLVMVYMSNGRVSMHTCCYNNLFLFVAGGIAGCYFMSYMCNVLSGIFGNCKAVQVTAKNTLLICAFHLVVFAMLKGVMLYVLNVDPGVLSGTLLPNALFALLSIMICLPIAWFVNRFLPWLAGKPTSR